MKYLFLAMLAAASLSSQALAQSTDFPIQVPGVNNFVAGAVGFVPDYLGSDDYLIGAAPAGLIKFGDTERFVRLVISDLSVNILDNATWTFGPSINWRFGRSNVDDNVVDRMSDIDGTLEVGAFGGWKWVSQADPRNRFTVGTEALFDVGGEHDGYTISGSVRYYQPVLRPLTLSIGAALTYGSGNYMDTYFGVDAGDAASSGLSPFSAGSGLRDFRVPLLAFYSFSENWHVVGGVVYSRLLGDAADSPVVDVRGSKDQFFTGVGIAYAW